MLGEVLLQETVSAGVLDSRPEALWLLIGTALMLLGTFYFIQQGVKNAETQEQTEYYVVTIMITTIAFFAYLSMYFGLGLTEVEVAGRGVLDIYWARYVDWLFTTPLLLLDLALLANATDRGTLLGLVLIDAAMIVTGLAGALSSTPVARYTWWAFSTILMIVLLYYLWSKLTARAQEMGEERASTFRTLRNLTLVLWAAYPVLWLVGTEGAGLLPLYHETLGFMVLDVLAKVGFGFYLLRSRAVLDPDEAPEPSAQAAD